MINEEPTDAGKGANQSRVESNCDDDDDDARQAVVSRGYEPLADNSAVGARVVVVSPTNTHR